MLKKSLILLLLLLISLSSWADNTNQDYQAESPVSVKLANGTTLNVSATNITFPYSVSTESAIINVSAVGGVPGILIRNEAYISSKDCPANFLIFSWAMVPSNFITDDPDYNKGKITFTLEEYPSVSVTCTGHYYYYYTYQENNYSGDIPITLKYIPSN